MPTLRFAAVQHDIVWNDPASNFVRLAPQVERAVGGGADVALLAETFSVGFGFRFVDDRR